MLFFALWYSIRPMTGQFPVAIHVKLTPSEFYWATVLITARQLRKVLWIFGAMGLIFTLLLVLGWLSPRPGADWYQILQNTKPLLWVFVVPLVLMFIAPWLNTRKFLSDKRFAQGDKFGFSETGIQIESSVGKADLNWTVFVDALETNSTFFLFLTAAQARVIPKRYLQAPGEVQTLRELLSAHLPKFKPRRD
jgi:hypothetical protein